MPHRDPARAGVCVVRAEIDGAAGLLITVTARADVEEEASTSMFRTTVIDDALARVAEFLTQYGVR